jgi:hypothetical protein
MAFILTEQTHCFSYPLKTDGITGDIRKEILFRFAVDVEALVFTSSVAGKI